MPREKKDGHQGGQEAIILQLGTIAIAEKSPNNTGRGHKAAKRPDALYGNDNKQSHSMLTTGPSTGLMPAH